MRVEVIAFDVNETLLDLRPLDATFERVFGDRAFRAQWFAQMLQLSFVGGLTGDYVDFSTAQRAAFEMLAARAGVETSPDEAGNVVEQMSALPAHPEVDEALRRLEGTGLKTVALVNSLESVGRSQLDHAGLADRFDAVISADSVQSLKPAPAPYQLVARTYGVDVSAVRLVAAHSWDVSGALSAGCRAAFVARPNMVLSPIGPQPDIVASDLDGVVEQILAMDGAL